MAEAPLPQTEHGCYAGGAGWFVLNLKDVRWWRRGLGLEAGLSGDGDYPQLGLGVQVLEPGEPMAMYHWETDQEDFLVLAGEALVVIEGEERHLRAWDFVHCPPCTAHAIVGAGDGPCVVFAVGSRERHTYVDEHGRRHGREDGGAYAVAEAAIRHGAGVAEETTDPNVAYARLRDRYPEPQPQRYGGWLPG